MSEEIATTEDATVRPMCASSPRTDDEPWEPWEGNGPCQDCGGRNRVWVAPNHTWNAVMESSVNRNGVGLLCPNCFITRAFHAGLDVVWSLCPEDNDAYWHARADERESQRRLISPRGSLHKSCAASSTADPEGEQK